MRKFQNRALIFTLMFLCAFLAKSGGKVEAAVDINGYYEGDDGGAYYIRQVGVQIYWFGESPNGDWANVLKGTITGNNIAARWWNVPKGKAKSMGEVALAISDNGATLTRVQLRGEVSLANTLTG